MRFLGCLLMLAGALLGLSTSAQAADLKVTPSTLNQAFADAQPGDTILLASGNYGTFSGGIKSGEVTLKEQDGATATMALSFRPASNITIDGLSISDSYIADSRTKNIIVRNSTFDGSRIVFRAESGNLANANILLERNKHLNVNVCSGCWDARVHISGRTEEPTGITVRDSLFKGGDGDGIQNGGHSVQIIGNEFRDMYQGVTDSGAHTDSIQLYGSKGTVIRRNFFYNVDMGNPGAYDRLDHETIEDNVVVSANYPFQTQLLSDNGSIVRHNTFVEKSVAGDGCDYSLPCGIVRMGNKEVDPPSVGTVFKDNVVAQLSITGSEPAFAENDYNLFTDVKGAGANSILGDPVYVGGANPTTYEGFALAAGSPGKGAASDGQDMGARIGASQPTPEPEPEPEPTPAQCGNGVDDDGDGEMDLADPGCTDLADNDETDPASEPAPEPESEPVTGATLFGTTTPTNPSAADGNAVELGTHFRASVDGQVRAIRFYKGAGNTGTHVGHLWTADGQQLAEVTFTDETASGWQEAQLSTPVAITGGQTYVASYLAPNGGYAYDSWFFQEAHVSGPLTAPSDGGVFVYGGGFPTSTYSATNYWVDVVFSEGTVAEPPPADPPTASYKYSPSKPKVGRAITFDATGSSCQASPCSYVWEDDGPDGPGGDQWPLGTGEVLALAFSWAGEKRVRLTVTDSHGRSDSTVQTVTVRR